MTLKALRSLRSSLAYEGWAMVSIGFICIALAFGASTATLPLLYDEVMTEFGWTRTQTTMIFAYKNVASAAMALFVIAPMYARFGVRAVMIGSLIITGLGMVSFLWIGSLASYYAAGFVLGLGVATVLISTKIFISRWFLRRQGLAIGVVLTGANFGGMIFPVLCEWLIESVGWRMAFALLSLGIWAVSLPLYAIKAKNNPTAEDTLPEALSIVPPDDNSEAKPWRVSSLMRSPSFWTIATCIFLVGAVDAGIFQHTALFLEREVGMSSRLAAYSISAIFGMGILAKILAGKVFDTWSIRGISFWYLLSAIAVAAALSIQGTLTLVIFVCLRSISHGGLVSETPIIAKHCYGPRLMDVTLPVFAGSWAVGAAVGPVALSIAYERSGSYQMGFLAFSLICVLAAALIYRVRPLYRTQMMAQERDANSTAPEPVLQPAAEGRLSSPR